MTLLYVGGCMDKGLHGVVVSTFTQHVKDQLLESRRGDEPDSYGFLS